MGAVYSQLSVQEHHRIEDWWHAKVPVAEMARALKRHKSAIYRHIYSKEGMARELWWYLPLHRKNRTPRHARKRQKSKFDRDVSILFRPSRDFAAQYPARQWMMSPQA